jgi:hypothetical protein
MLSGMMGSWCRPTNRNEGGYHFVYVGQDGDQRVQLRFVDTTVSSRHDVKLRYVEALVAAFCACYECSAVTFFFVIPSGCAGQFEVGTVDTQCSLGRMKLLGWAKMKEKEQVQVLEFEPRFNFT